VHHQIQTAAPPATAHNFLLYTDGSGHQDKYGGSASLVIENATGERFTTSAANYGTTVSRAEFEGLLSGLQSILEYNGKLQDRPTVAWYSDRESLVLAVHGFYRRKAEPDLWARFQYYETLFSITPLFVPRSTDPLHDVVDRMASEGRIMMKEYIESVRLEGLDLTQPKLEE